MADLAGQLSQALPLSIQEVEQLVKTLYNPIQAKKVPETEATLRLLQRSPQGWEIGDALLRSDDEQVRFFGALTLTIKLNADSAGLSEQDAEQLLSKLIYHLVSRPSASVATRKLTSTLAQYFTKPISTWTQCIRSLIASLAVQQPVLDDALSEQPSTWDVVPQLSDDQLLVLLEFAMNLADDAKKLTNMADRSAHGRILENIESMEILLQVTFARGIKYMSPPDDPASVNLNEQGERICVKSLKCFTSWIFYVQAELKEDTEKMKHLRSVTELALTCLEFHVEDAMELVADILEQYPRFFEQKQQEALWAAITSQWGLDILAQLDAETASLARIIAAYGQLLLNAETLYTEPNNAHNQQVLSFLHDLLKYREPVGGEDEVAPVVLDFWSNYVSQIAEATFTYTEDKRPHWFESAKHNVFLAVSELLQKIIYPPIAVKQSWDSDAKKTFKVFRVDVRDIIMEAYESLRDAMTDQFVDFSIRALETNDWLELEAGLFCLISVSDSLNHRSNVQLDRLFERPLFSVMSANSDIPVITRRGAVDLVASFNSFFLSNPQFLPQVLQFLLAALAQPSLAHSAAKSFASLCSQCRKSLTGELVSFFQMYEQFLTYQTAEEFTKSKVLEGIAAIVQAQESESERLAGVRQLFQYITQDAMHAINITKEGNDPEQGQVYALTTLKCLVCVGRSLQALDEDVIDLVSDYESSSFWTEGPGKEIQNQVINFVNYLTQVFPANDDIIEAACDVLRTGFKETVPGPFVLPTAAAVDFITKSTIQTPRLIYVLETACCWISSNRYKKTGEFQEQAQRLLRHDLSIMQALQHPRSDPEVSVTCIELIQNLINVDASILKVEQPEILKGMFDFSVECIKSPEVLPKRASAKLWKEIFELSANTHDAHQGTAQDIVAHFGPATTFALISNICGEVDATSLDHILAPLRKLILSDRNARNYITGALMNQTLIQRVQQDQAARDTVRKFIESAMRNAKNSTAFKEAVKAFWQSCKQMQMQFAPPIMHPGHRFAHGRSPLDGPY